MHRRQLAHIAYHATVVLRLSPATIIFDLQWSVAIKDTIDEFQEAGKAAAAANAGKPAAPESTQDTRELGERLGGLSVSGEVARIEDDYDFDDMDEDYSQSELRCLEASIDVLRVFRRCLKSASDSLNTLDLPQTPGDGKAAAESKSEGWLKGRLQWAQAWQGCLDEANECAGELGILLYPPLSGNDLSGRADDLERTLNAFCDVFESEDPAGKVAGGVGGQLPLRTLVGDKIGALRAVVAEL